MVTRNPKPFNQADSGKGVARKSHPRGPARPPRAAIDLLTATPPESAKLGTTKIRHGIKGGRRSAKLPFVDALASSAVDLARSIGTTHYAKALGHLCQTALLFGINELVLSGVLKRPAASKEILSSGPFAGPGSPSVKSS